jgi:hypothetical protein
MHEIVAVALQWVGVNLGPPGSAVIWQLFPRHRGAGGVLERPDHWRLAGFFADLLRWLEFNLRRSGARDAGERSIAGREVARALRSLGRFPSSVHLLASALSA